MSHHCKPRCGKFILLAVLGLAALGGVVMALWNWLLPTLFLGIKEISYLQALGLLLLSRILFGGFRGHGGRHWRAERWERMTPEEREKFAAGMRLGFCSRGKASVNGGSTDQPSAPAT